MNIAVLGAGNGGIASAADLSLRGFAVNLYESPEFEANLKPIRERGGIEIAGAAGNGFINPKKVTTNIQEAIEDVDLIIVVAPAYAHSILARKFAPYLQNQPVILNPGHTGGALEFARTLKEAGYSGKIRRR